jgi:hypothetical protein
MAKKSVPEPPKPMTRPSISWRPGKQRLGTVEAPGRSYRHCLAAPIIGTGPLDDRSHMIVLEDRSSLASPTKALENAGMIKLLRGRFRSGIGNGFCCRRLVLARVFPETR